jgi:hypothetical protein
MNIDQVLRHLRRAPNDATVLLLPEYSVASECEIVRAVSIPRHPWVHEQHRRADGHVDHLFHPSAEEWAEGFPGPTDQVSLERVVILAAGKESVEHALGETAPEGRISMEELRAAEAQGHREMLASGQLLTDEDFRARLGVSRKRLANMLGEGSVFALDVDGETAYPAFLCNKALDLKRLRAVARILVPAPPTSRLDLLTRQCGALGARVPLDLLVDDRDYRSLRRFAKGWASEFSRTVVKCYNAEQSDGTPLVEPLYTCATEIDPRRLLWKRALDAIRSPGYRFPHEIPRSPSTLLIRVERATAGESAEALEARLLCDLNGRTLRVSVTTADGHQPAIAHKLKLATKRPSVTDVCDAVFSMLKKLARVQTT